MTESEIKGLMNEATKSRHVGDGANRETALEALERNIANLAGMDLDPDERTIRERFPRAAG
jgi:hypothetical protein